MGQQRAPPPNHSSEERERVGGRGRDCSESHPRSFPQTPRGFPCLSVQPRHHPLWRPSLGWGPAQGLAGELCSLRMEGDSITLGRNPLLFSYSFTVFPFFSYFRKFLPTSAYTCTSCSKTLSPRHVIQSPRPVLCNAPSALERPFLPVPRPGQRGPAALLPSSLSGARICVLVSGPRFLLEGGLAPPRTNLRSLTPVCSRVSLIAPLSSSSLGPGRVRLFF